MFFLIQNEEQLSTLRSQQIWERQKEKGKNILIVFTLYEGVGSEEELLTVGIKIGMVDCLYLNPTEQIC